MLLPCIGGLAALATRHLLSAMACAGSGTAAGNSSSSGVPAAVLQVPLLLDLLAQDVAACKEFER